MHNSLLPTDILQELTTRWAGRGEIRYEQRMDSTNLTAKAMARAGAVHGSLAICEEQTAGRGRMQRTWDTPAGEALTFSAVLRPRIPAQQAQLITLAAAIAAARAIEDVCPQLKPGIKWPNDVVISGRKCVGVLCEMAVDGQGLAWIVPGIGINVNQNAFAQELADKATSLLLEVRKAEPQAASICRRRVLCACLARMEQAVDKLEAQGLAGLMDDYLARSVTIGSRVRVLGVGEEFTGIAKAIDETGALIVTDETGCDRTVLCGDVSVRGLMGYCD